MVFGKRIPKRKSSCCTSCTTSHDTKKRTQGRPRVRKNDDSEPSQDLRKPRRSVKKSDPSVTDEERDVSFVRWMSDTSSLDNMNLLEKPDVSSFHVYLNHLHSGINLNGVDSGDLLTLTGRNSVSYGAIKKIESLLNVQTSNILCFCFNDFLADEKGMTQIIQNKWPLNRLVMYLCVHKEEFDEETYLVELFDNDKIHFTLAVFDFDSLNLTYADTLGWDVPEQFVTKLEELFSNLNSPSVFHTVLCHSPNDLECHTCDDNCSPLYPLQTCDTASGIAVIICMVIACLKYDIYLSLAMGISNAESLCFRYIQDISDHSKILRLVIISWIAVDFVNFNNIASCDELVRRPEYNLSTELKKQFSNIFPKESKPSTSCINIKTEPDLNVTNFTEMGLGSSHGLEEMIACRPVVHFCKPASLRLKLTLKDGRSLYKMFKCTGKGDQAAMRVITEFLNSYKVIDWVKSKTFKNMSIIPNTRLRKNKTCNLLDFPDEIQGYFIKNPELSFERKLRYLVLRVYVRGCPSVVTKKFRCSLAGKHDNQALKRINAYICSKEFRDLVVTNAGAEFKFSPEKLKHATFEELVMKKPVIHHVKEHNILKLECQLRTGRRIYRGFPCSHAGKGDLKTMALIGKFLASKEASDWVRSKYEIKLDKKKDQRQKVIPKPLKDDVWIPSGDLAVGFEVKSFFDSIDFDFRKRIVMAKGVQSYYEGNAIITENERWGKTHRFDETYVIDETLVTDKVSFPAVTMYITCSSKSSQCKAQCGTPLKDLANTAIGTECPGCHTVLDFPTKECVNCSTNSTPKWYSVNGDIMCSACYQYQVKHNDSRPSELKVKSAQGMSRLYHPHFLCGWRLKLIIYSNNLATWKLFKHKDNADFHSVPEMEMTDRKPDVTLLPTHVSSKSPKSPKIIIRNKDTKSILCSRCISENITPPFVCTSQTSLMKHIATAHKINFINCATCWADSGSIVNFENESQLQQHIQESHHGGHRYPSDMEHDRDNDSVETRQVELDEAVIALLEPTPM